MKSFYDLPEQLRNYINERFAHHNMSGEAAFNHPGIFPDELKNMSPNNMIQVLENKDISHIMPVSKYPELSDNLDNVIFEDIRTNRSRQAEVMTDTEKDMAMDDLLSDINDGDFNDDGIKDLETILINTDEIEMLDIIGASLPIGLVLSGAQVFNDVKNNEIQLNDAPKWFLYKTGGKSIKLAFVGTMLATGSPIIVSGTVGYILYRSKSLIKKVIGGLYNSLISESAINIYKGTGSIISSTAQFSVQAVKSSYNVATHDITKKAVKKTSWAVWDGTKWVGKQYWEGTKISFKGLKWISKKGYELFSKSKK